jgi:hypothetical protein
MLVMTESQLEELLSDCPILYHMAESGSWQSIRERGLLSTTALLNLYEVQGIERISIEAERRPVSITLSREGLPSAVVRDQIPMDDFGLRRCLPPHLIPADWYRTLNSKVFFWLTRARLLRLLSAAAYRTKIHDVLELDSRRLIEACFDKIWFCPINSGCTKPVPHPRSETTFLRITEYPYEYWRKKRRPGERVVELAVDFSVPNIAQYTKRVVQMQGETELCTLLASDQ